MKRFALVVASFITLVAVLFPTPLSADEGWDITRFDSAITILETGSIQVKETLAVDFHNLSKHGIFRDLPYVYDSEQGPPRFTDIKVMSVLRNGQSEPFTSDTNDVFMRIKIGDADKTISQKQVYEVTYSVTGVLQAYETYDELYWNVTGFDWAAPIDAVHATVTLPKDGLVQVACYRGRAGSTEQCAADTTTPAQATFSTGPLAQHEGMTLAVGYTSGMVPIVDVAPPPSLFERIKWGPILGGFGVTVLLGAWLVYRRWHKHGRDQWFGHRANTDGEAAAMPVGMKESIAPEFSPPENIRPAMMGTLVDERADTLDVSSTIVDLAVRGFLTITEEKKKGWFGGTDYLLNKKKKSESELFDYEKKLLSALFATGNDIRLSDLKNTFYDDLADVKKSLYVEVVKQKFFVKNPETVRFGYYGAGAALVIVGGILVFFMSAFGAWEYWLPALGVGSVSGIILVGFIVLVTAHTMPARTAHGRHLYRQSLGYKLFVSQVEKYRAPFMEKRNMFEQVLPYAMIFGVTQQLANAMKVLGVQPPQPVWYTGIHPFNPTVFAKDVNTFSSTLSSTMASSPSSSGSGGGGFSGGGFGGGGGGSW